MNFIALFFDSSLLFICSILAGDYSISGIHQPDFYCGYFLKLTTLILLLAKNHLYKSVYRYFGWNFFRKLIKIFIYYFLIAYLGLIIFGLPVSFNSFLFETLALFNMLALSRLAISSGFINYLHIGGDTPSGKRVLIYGAGEAGIQLTSTFVNKSQYLMIGYVDDDPNLTGKLLNGYSIFPGNNLSHLVKDKNVDEIFIALPSVDELSYKRIIHNLSLLSIPIKTLPKLNQLPNGKVQFELIKQVDIEDLLLREAVPPIANLLSQDILSKVVLVTGAGGSIGSELCRKILAQSPAMVIMVDHSEFNLYKIFDEVKESFGKSTSIIPLLTTVLDKDLLSKIFEKWRPDVVYHAAAYKHVSLVEGNLISGIRNNIWGTWNIVDVALANNCKKFILVSTDKAVRPTSVMGTTKRIAELILQAKNAQILSGELSCSTILTMVRFGNVLGSSGSVVPLFQRQILQGGPITVSHPDVVRFFMTIGEAAQLVIQAGAISSGGDVYLLDMGQPVKIMDLAKKLVEISGLEVRDHNNPNGDIEIKISSLMPGEKLYEEMLINNQLEFTEHQKIYKGNEIFLPWADLVINLEDLHHACRASDYQMIKKYLMEMVPEYSGKDIVDYLFNGLQ